MRLKRFFFIVGFSSAAFVSVNAQGTRAASGQPAEVQETGPLNAAIPFTQLLYVSDPGIDRFVYNTSKSFYLLLTGKWFRTLEAPWFHAGNRLSIDFAEKLPGLPAGASNTEMMMAQVPRCR